MRPPVGPVNAHITVPVHCRYAGGSAALGTRGHHLWIRDGRIGHGEFGPTHSVALDEVTGVTVESRLQGGSEGSALLAMGGRSGRGVPATSPELFTDITVHLGDGSTALWVVEHKDAAWVRDRIGPALAASGVPWTEDLPADRRPTFP